MDLVSNIKRKIRGINMKYEWSRSRIDKIPTEKIEKELLSVAKKMNYYKFTKSKFDDSKSKISSATIIRQFKGWNKAMIHLQDILKKKNITLKEMNRSYYSEDEYYSEMERIWNLIGHRPSKTEWDNSNPKISYITYRRFFTSWELACLKFIEHKMGKEIHITGLKQPIKYQPRDPSYKLRYQVFSRDNATCKCCGRSPQFNPELKLQIDHIIPFSKGGKTELDNLQLLCSDCHYGKSIR